MAVVILGDPGHFSEHDLVQQAVEERGVESHVVDVGDWPGNGPVEYTVDDGECVFDEPIPFEDVTGVFTIIQSVFPSFPVVHDWFEEKPDRVAYRQLMEWKSLFRSMIRVFEEHGAEVTASPAEWYWNRHRPLMLETYQRNGLPVPETTFSNDPDRVEAFVQRHGKAMVQAVNGGGGEPELIRPSDLDPERLAKLAAAPIKLQEFVPGEDLRGYVVDGEFAGMIRYDYVEDAISFKSEGVDPGEIGSTAVSPDSDLREAVVRAGELCPSAFAAVDVRRTEDGEFTILETNTPGRFAAHDRAGTTDVSGRLAEYLIE